MTTTQIITNATVGATGTYGSNASVTTLQSTTLRLSIGVQLTNGAHSGDLESFLRVYFATSPVSMSAAAATQALRKQAKYWDIRPHPTPSAVTCENVGPLIPQGQYCYVWTEEPTFSVSGTLNAWIVEVQAGDAAADAAFGTTADVAGASAAVANQTGMSRLSGIWTVLGSLTDAAATAWDNTSNSISSLLRGIGGMIKSTVTAPGSTPTAVVNVQGSKQAQFISAIVHETGKTLNAEDVIGPITTPLDAVISNIVPVAAQPFRILQARLEIDSIVASVLAAQIDVIIYNDAAAVAPIAGNAQNTWLYVNGTKRLGRIQFGPFNTSGTGSTMAAAYGSFQDGKAAFTDLFPAAQAISWRCVNKVTGTIFATGQNVRLILDVCYQ